MSYRWPPRRSRHLSIRDEVAAWLRTPSLPPLTERQHEVIRRLAAGQPVPQIADELGISRQRIYQIVAGVRRKIEGDPRRP